MTKLLVDQFRKTQTLVITGTPGIGKSHAFSLLAKLLAGWSGMNARNS